MQSKYHLPNNASQDQKLLKAIHDAIQNNSSIIDGTSGSTDLLPGITVLTGDMSFDTASPGFGTNVRSLSLSIISLTTGTVVVNTSAGDTDISYAGFSTSWSVDRPSDKSITPLTITTSGDAVVIITYTAI